MKRKQRLDRRTVKAIERFLKARHAELRGAMVRAMTRPCASEGGQFADILEWASNSAQDEIQCALMDRHRRQAVQIEAALDRLGRGEYGICRACGELIDPARLRALPFAQRCAPCQARAERGVRRGARPVAAVSTT